MARFSSPDLDTSVPGISARSQHFKNRLSTTRAYTNSIVDEEKENTWLHYVETAAIFEQEDDSEDEDWVPPSENEEDTNTDEDEIDNEDKVTHVAQKYQYPQVTFLSAIFWSSVSILLCPFLLLWGCCVGTKEPGYYPMGYSSASQLLGHSIANVSMLVIYSWALYFYLLGDKPEWDSASMARFGSKCSQVFHQGYNCVLQCYHHQAVSSQSFAEVLFSTECFPILPEIMTFLAYILAMWNFHKIWPRVIFFTTLLALSVCQYLPINQLMGTAPMIYSFDPAFAQLHEPTLIMIQGKNLKQNQDTTIGWISYLGCASMSEDLGDCALMYEEKFKAGLVAVTFDLADEYIPCYKKSTFETPVCFEQLRLRVREKHSIPGWSAKIQKHPKDDVVVEEFQVNARRGGIHRPASI